VHTTKGDDLTGYHVNGMTVAAVLRSIARDAERHARWKHDDTRPLNAAECAALRKVARLTNEARRTLERA
jgi:hypothetical protein